jgi:hypothetical protein
VTLGFGLCPETRAQSLQVFEQPRERVVDHLGELADKRRDLSLIQRIRNCHWIGQHQPDCRTGDDGGNDADEDGNARDAVETALEIMLRRRVFEFNAHGSIVQDRGKSPPGSYLELGRPQLWLAQIQAAQ